MNANDTNKYEYTNDIKIKGIYVLTLAKGGLFGKLRARGFGNSGLSVFASFLFIVFLAV